MDTNQEMTWSAFLREPSSVEPLLEHGDVVLKRRDGEPLRLSRSSKGQAERQAIAAAARLLAPVLSEGAREAVEKMADVQLPWTRFLPERDRHEFVTDFLRQFEACADLGDFSALGRLLAEWKNTATAYADGLGDELKRPIAAVGERVRRPGR